MNASTCQQEIIRFEGVGHTRAHRHLCGKRAVWQHVASGRYYCDRHKKAHTGEDTEAQGTWFSERLGIQHDQYLAERSLRVDRKSAEFQRL